MYKDLLVSYKFITFSLGKTNKELKCQFYTRYKKTNVKIIKYCVTSLCLSDNYRSTSVDELWTAKYKMADSTAKSILKISKLAERKLVSWIPLSPQESVQSEMVGRFLVLHTLVKKGGSSGGISMSLVRSGISLLLVFFMST